ncbi:MAG: inositol-3-phosphate synthase [Myxococcaceae bacterium]|nr:inositol-3-phosphate synthase [Myxococcaceae bacterium]
MNATRPEEADGKLAVLIPGLGAVATTLIAGVMRVRRGLSTPVGSFTQMGALEVDGIRRPVNEVLPLAALDQLEFGGWDIFPDNALEAARHAEVLRPEHLQPVAEELANIVPMPGAFFPQYVKRLQGTHVKPSRSRRELVELLREDIRRFVREKGCTRAVGIWCGSTETYVEPTETHQSITAFERGLDRDDPAITASQLYAWAFLKEGVPFVNGAPNLTVDFPAAVSLAIEMGVPIAGKDFKTGQTLMKTVLAPMLKARHLGLRGWFSTNILGNRDGEVLDDPESFRTKEVSKLGVLEQILQPASAPELYGRIDHKVCIEYYPPRGDEKEGWDNIDLFGWLGYPMQLKINFLCRDSILAAPLVLDLVLLTDLAKRAQLRGVQDWLGFFFKSPMSAGGSAPEHDLFRQRAALERALLTISGR